jgi:hypothetical protein
VRRPSPKIYDCHHSGKTRSKILGEVRALEKILEEGVKKHAGELGRVALERSQRMQLEGPVFVILAIARASEAIELFDKVGWRSLIKYEGMVGDPMGDAPREQPPKSPEEAADEAEMDEAVAGWKDDLKWRTPEDVIAEVEWVVEDMCRENGMSVDEMVAREEGAVKEAESEALQQLTMEFPALVEELVARGLIQLDQPSEPAP